MIPKKLEIITKTKISTKIVVGTVILTGLVAGSLVVTALFPGANISMLATAASKPPPPPAGWCVTKLGVFGSNGYHTTKAACEKRGTATDPSTFWYAFCPDIAGQGERSQGSCNSKYTDLVKSPLLIQLIGSRENLINALNDGKITTEDSLASLQYLIPINLGFACTVYSSGNLDLANTTKKDYVFSGAPGEPIKGTAQFLVTVGKLFSHMVKPENKCELFLPTCKITSSLRSCTCNKTDPKNSAHCCGEAVDIYCSDMYNKLCDTNQTSRDKVAALNAKIKAAGPVFVIRECYLQEKNACGDKGTSPVIHFDIKTNHNTAHQPPCVYNGCDFTTCN